MSQIAKLEHKKIQKLLIANRGEIACRIIKTARRLGIRTIAIYSEADQKAIHVGLADEAYSVGPANAKESYLNIPKIIEVARQSNANAIHPGYGFLSENPDFAEACAREGILFIGPTPEAIRSMGSKSHAKEIAKAAGLPLIPGYHGADQSESELFEQAKRMGFPLIIKAVMGGGGKGMRIVENEAGFQGALSSCRREAQSAFGDDAVLLEKYISIPRHVEIQIFGDNHGNIVHLFERDCSLQRRHQKILEEAPAFGLSENLRHEMQNAAIHLAKAVGYRGAGTVEFLVDSAGEFYFMEMNTRLQVEHPVTEEITGLDLVEWQIRVAEGEGLPCLQTEIQAQGHAIEVRLYAEDPQRNFLPQTGIISVFDSVLPDARIESGVRVGSEITSDYDPMIAKLIVKGGNREEALQRAEIALRSWRIGGVSINQEFLLKLVQDSRVHEGSYDVGFLDHTSHEFVEKTHDPVLDIGAALAFLSPPTLTLEGPWDQNIGWALQGYRPQSLQMIKGFSEDVLIDAIFSLEGWIFENYGCVQHSWNGEGEGVWQLQISLSDTTKVISVFTQENRCIVFSEGQTLAYTRHFPWETVASQQDTEHHLKAPMTSKVIEVRVKENDTVARGESLVILEAMKMEHAIKASHPSLVKRVFYKMGDSVEEGAELVELEPLEEDYDEVAKAS